MPYALDGAKRPSTELFQPSDQNLWALWLAAEYATGTGDLRAFEAPLAYHPSYDAPPAPLSEHLWRQFSYFRDVVGVGEHGHVRMRNADWNDAAISLSDVDRRAMIERGESVLNSAFAAWVMPVYAGLCDRLGDAATAYQARAVGDRLRRRRGLRDRTGDARGYSSCDRGLQCRRDRPSQPPRARRGTGMAARGRRPFGHRPWFLADVSRSHAPDQSGRIR